MGRPRKPTPLKVLEGTDRKDRANPTEPHPVDLPGDAPPPDWLNDHGKEAWADLLPVLRGMGVVTIADPTAFALLCDALGEYRTARAWIGDHEDVYSVVAENGSITWRKRPEVEIAQDAWRRAKTMLTEFGLTPAARSRVSGKTADSGDPLEKWMTG
jgi:P27 family predicted phage terminase small subunit